MIDMHSKYDKNGMFYALICINNCTIVCQNYALSVASSLGTKLHRVL